MLFAARCFYAFACCWGDGGGIRQGLSPPPAASTRLRLLLEVWRGRMPTSTLPHLLLLRLRLLLGNLSERSRRLLRQLLGLRLPLMPATHHLPVNYDPLGHVFLNKLIPLHSLSKCHRM